MEIMLHLNEKPQRPLYQILSDALKEAITSQRLSYGHPLPSARILANQYNFSVATVLRAYEDLSSQGIITTKPKVGTTVALRLDCPKSLSADSLRQISEPVLSHYAKQLLSATSCIAEPRDAGIVIPNAELLPIDVWQRLLSKNKDCYLRDTKLFDYSADQFGHPALRSAIAGLIKRTRGIHCSTEQIVVTSSVRLDLVCRMLIDSGSDVAIENPCFPGARKIFLSYGANTHNIDTDSDGLISASLSSRKCDFRMLYLSPSHQDPSGVPLSLDRRRAILDWSIAKNVIIYENDFDCNYYYEERPLPALLSLCENDTVIYSGSFWLTLGPLTSSGFLVLPNRYVNAFRSLLATVHSEHPVLENHTLAEFISEGYLERHMHQQRKIFIRRRQAVLHALSITLRKLISIKGSSGTHVLIQFDHCLEESAILKCAQEARLPLKSTRFYYEERYPRNEFLIPFSNQTEEMLEKAVANFSSELLRTS